MTGSNAPNGKRRHSQRALAAAALKEKLAAAVAEIPLPPPDTGPDVEALAIAARQGRVNACEREVFAALQPILDKHRCRLGTIQEIVDGRPGPARVVVFAND